MSFYHGRSLKSPNYASLCNEIYQENALRDALDQLNQLQASKSSPLADCFERMCSFEAKDVQRIIAEHAPERQVQQPEALVNYAESQDALGCNLDVQTEELSNQTQETLTVTAQHSPRIHVEEEAKKEEIKQELKDATAENDVNEKRAKADPCLKKIMRAFRKEVKDEFVAVYGKRYFHWVDHKLRKRVKYFFTTKNTMKGVDGSNIEGYQFAEDFFERNEAIFFSLINNTKKDLEQMGIENSGFR